MLDLNYVEPVFRPPSEWRSLILQVTNGCSWNQCTYCEMYQDPQKSFRFKDICEARKELQYARSIGVPVEKIFLADGDAMTLSTRRLTLILDAVNEIYPDVKRVSAYCLPRNVRHKSVAELKQLKDKGLSLAYVGIESGDETLLSYVKKGETFQSSLDALLKLHEAGIKTSVMILNGLGGKSRSQEHAEASAELMNLAQPKYLSTLVVSFPKGTERFLDGFPDYQPLSQDELFRELHYFISQLDLKATIYRSDHASNALPLKGTLPKDKNRLLDILSTAIHSPERMSFRPEYLRGL